MMWKLACFAVGVAAGVVSGVVYQAKIRDRAWLEKMAAKLKRKASEIKDADVVNIVVEK